MARSRRPDTKSEALRQQGALNPSPGDVVDELFQESDFFDPRDLVQVKYEMLRRSRQEGWSVTKAAASFGLSRPSYYAAQAAFDRDGLGGLMARKRGPQGAHKLNEPVMTFVEEIRRTVPAVSAMELTAKIRERFQITVHRRSLERALRRQEKKVL